MTVASGYYRGGEGEGSLKKGGPKGTHRKANDARLSGLDSFHKTEDHKKKGRI